MATDELSADSQQAGSVAAGAHVLDPSGTIAISFTEPPGAVLQLVRPARGTTEIAEWLAGPGLELLLQRFADARELRVILDMRRMTGRSASARAVLLQAGLRAAGRISHVVLLPSLHMGPAYLAVVETAAALLRLSGQRVDIEHDLAHVMERHGVRVLAEGRRSPSPGGAGPLASATTR